VERGERRSDLIEFCSIARALGEDENAMFAEVLAALPSDLRR
jgi:hypothetical protein